MVSRNVKRAPLEPRRPRLSASTGRASARSSLPALGVSATLLVLAGCGGDPDPANAPARDAEASAPVAAAGATEPSAPAALEAAADKAGRSAPAAKERHAQAVLREIPNTCALLTAADVSELLGEPVGEGWSQDIASLHNCVWQTSSGQRQLVLVAHLGPDASVEDTQAGIWFRHCNARVVTSIEDLGVAGALFRSPPDPCTENLSLWVATDVHFEGKTNPDLIRTVKGRIHLVIHLRPPGDASSSLPVLRSAAERALAGLR